MLQYCCCLFFFKPLNITTNWICSQPSASQCLQLRKKIAFYDLFTMFSNWTAKEREWDDFVVLLCICFAFVSFSLRFVCLIQRQNSGRKWCVAIYGFTNSNPSLQLIYNIFDSPNAFYLHKCSQSILSWDKIIYIQHLDRCFLFFFQFFFFPRIWFLLMKDLLHFLVE